MTDKQWRFVPNSASKAEWTPNLREVSSIDLGQGTTCGSGTQTIARSRIQVR